MDTFGQVMRRLRGELSVRELVVGDPALISIVPFGLIRSGQTEAGCAFAHGTLLELPDGHRTDIFVRAARRVVSVLPRERAGIPSAKRLRASIRSCAVAR